MEKETPKYRIEPFSQEFRYRGRVLVRLVFAAPVLEDKNAINGFYARMRENLCTYCEALLAEKVALLQSGSREARSAVRESLLRFSPRIMCLDARYLSVVFEIFRVEKGTRPRIERMAQTFLLDGELLLPCTYFTDKKEKHDADASYYLTDEGIVFL